jgi:hypothetical protein
VTALAIPEPANASPAAVRKVLESLPALRDSIRDRQDLAAALELHRRLEALANYVGNRKVKKEVLGEDRRTEVLVGQLLGKGQRGRPKIQSQLEIPRGDRDQFRLMAEFVEVVERVIARGTPERRRILAAIKEEQRPRHDGPVDADLRIGDFRDVLSDLADVDAIITDPPYGREWTPLYVDLAEWANGVLRPDGVVAVMCGHYWLPEQLAALTSKLAYRWVLSYMTPGPAARIHPSNVTTQWKPVLVFGGRDIPIGCDVVRSDDLDKSHHEWGQSCSGFERLLRLLTAPGWHVVDPFLGGGTTAVAAQRTGRRFTGSDIDGAHVLTARRRLA